MGEGSFEEMSLLLDTIYQSGDEDTCISKFLEIAHEYKKRVEKLQKIQRNQ